MLAAINPNGTEFLCRDLLGDGNMPKQITTSGRYVILCVDHCRRPDYYGFQCEFMVGYLAKFFVQLRLVRTRFTCDHNA